VSLEILALPEIVLRIKSKKAHSSQLKAMSLEVLVKSFEIT